MKKPFLSGDKPSAAHASSLRELIRQFQVGVPYAQLARLAEQTPVNTAVTLALAVSISTFVLVQVWLPWMLVWAVMQAGLILAVSIRWRKSYGHPAPVSGSFKSAIHRSEIGRAFTAPIQDY